MVLVFPPPPFFRKKRMIIPYPTYANKIRLRDFHQTEFDHATFVNQKSVLCLVLTMEVHFIFKTPA